MIIFILLQPRLHLVYELTMGKMKNEFRNRISFDLRFKVWRLTGELVYQYKTNENQELWQVLWQPGTFERGHKSVVKSEDGSTAGKRNETKTKTLETKNLSYFIV